MSRTYRVKDLDGYEWVIVRQPCGWIAYDERDPSWVLDPYRTLRETKEAVKRAQRSNR